MPLVVKSLAWTILALVAAAVLTVVLGVYLGGGR